MSAILGAVGAASKFNPLLVGLAALCTIRVAMRSSLKGIQNNQVLNVGEPIPDETVGERRSA